MPANPASVTPTVEPALFGVPWVADRFGCSARHTHALDDSIREALGPSGGPVVNRVVESSDGRLTEGVEGPVHRQGKGNLVALTPLGQTEGGCHAE